MKSDWMMGFVAALVWSLLSGSVLAESYNDYSNNYNSTIGPAESTILPAAEALGKATGSSAVKTGDPAQGLRTQLNEKRKKVQKAIERSGKETELRTKVAKWRDSIDKLKLTRALPDIILQTKLKEKEQQYKDAQQFFSQLNQSTQGISGADVNVSGLENSCRSGVDFSQFKALADQMGTEPFRYLRNNGQKILEEKNKEAKEAKIKNLQKLAAHFDTIAQEDDAQNDVTKIDALKLDNSVEASIRKLEAKGKSQKKEIKDLRQDLVKGFFDMIGKVSDIAANDQRIAQLANFFADNLENYRKAVLDTAVVGAQQLKSNCDGIVDSLGTNPDVEGNLNVAYRWAARTNPEYANQSVMPVLRNISKNLRCTDAAAPLEDIFGTNLQTAINNVRSQKDPRSLIQGAMATLQAVGAAQAQVGQALQPLMSDCQYAAQQAKKVEQYVQTIKSQMEQQQQQQDSSGGQRRRSASRSGDGSGSSSRSRNGAGSGRFGLTHASQSGQR